MESKLDDVQNLYKSDFGKGLSFDIIYFRKE